MSKYFPLALTAILCLTIGFLSAPGQNPAQAQQGAVGRYQAERIDDISAVILDTTTGDHWFVVRNVGSKGPHSLPTAK